MVHPRLLLAGCLAVGLLAGAGVVRGAANLVFVPLAPCRVIDTRVSGAGGPLVAGTPRSFVFRGPTLDYQNPTPLPNQGGSTTGCGIPDLTSDASPLQNIAKAVAINIVAVGPSGAGDLRAWPANQTMPAASVINYAAVTGLNLANGVIVPMCDEVSATPCSTGDITFRADVSGTNLVVDVVGYFHAGSTAATVRNTALGERALQANTTGVLNVATGYIAMYHNTSGFENTADGAEALLFNSTGNGNTGIGSLALRQNDTGSYNTAVGVRALYGYPNSGSRNTAAGFAALSRNSTGTYNTAIGNGTLFYNQSGASNTAAGGQALQHNATGSLNTATGFRALQSTTTSGLNTAAGAYALTSNVTGKGNTAIGFQALETTTGDYNIGIGAAAGSNATGGGFGNVFISNGGVAGDTETIRIGGPQARTFVAGIRGVTTGNNDAVNVVIDSAGQLGTVSSSIRFKEDVHDLGAAADRVLSLRPVSFRYKHPFANGEKPVQYGLIAEQVEKVLPELVAYGRDGKPETVKYQVLPTLLLGELERQNARLREKDEQIVALEARIEALERQAGTRGSPANGTRTSPR